MLNQRLPLRAVQVLRDEGIVSLTGQVLAFCGEALQRRTLPKQKRRVVDDFSSQTKYLNLGGGRFVRVNWRVLDHPSDEYTYDPIFIDFDIDLESASRWPIENSDYKLVYSSHTLEHITEKAVKNTLNESFRILKPGGVIRLELPDMDLIMDRYENRDISWFEKVLNPPHWTTEAPWRDGTYVSKRVPPDYKLEFYLIHTFATHLVRNNYESLNYAEIRKDAEVLERSVFFEKYTSMIRQEWQAMNPLHQNWFTDNRLRSLLADAGFESINRSACRQSSVTEMCTLGFDTRPRYSFYMEAVKPSGIST